MEKKVFLNCTNHNLTQEQKKVAKEKFQVDEFINLKELNSDLFSILSSMKLEDDVENLCAQLMCTINEIEADEVYIHLPIGTPYFMAYLFYNFLPYVGLRGKEIYFLFSYSERKVVEKNINGKIEKKSIFQFIDYQIIKHINDVLR